MIIAGQPADADRTRWRTSNDFGHVVSDSWSDRCGRY
jgi:hypothetical protein